MQQNSRVDVISNLNGTICRLGNSVDSLRLELNRLKTEYTDLHLYYTDKSKHFGENIEESTCQKNKGYFSEMDDIKSKESIAIKKKLGKNKSEHDVTFTNLQCDVEKTSGDMNGKYSEMKTKEEQVNVEHLKAVKDNGDILITSKSSKNPLKKLRVEENKPEIMEIEPVVYDNDSVKHKKMKKKCKSHKLKPLINFNERIARERLHSIKERIIALTQELPAIETNLEDNETQEIFECQNPDPGHQQLKFIKHHQPFHHTNNQVYYKNVQRPDLNKTWREQKNIIKDRLKAGSLKLDFKGSNISKISGYGENIRN